MVIGEQVCSDVCFFVYVYSVRVCRNSRIPNFYSQVLNCCYSRPTYRWEPVNPVFSFLLLHENKESLFHTRFNVLSMLVYSVALLASYTWCFTLLLLNCFFFFHLRDCKFFTKQFCINVEIDASNTFGQSPQMWSLLHLFFSMYFDAFCLICERIFTLAWWWWCY